MDRVWDDAKSQVENKLLLFKIGMASFDFGKRKPAAAPFVAEAPRVIFCVDLPNAGEAKELNQASVREGPN